MKLKVIKAFGDHVEGVIRQAGEIFEVTKERFATLSAKVPDDFYDEVKTAKTKKAEEE